MMYLMYNLVRFTIWILPDRGLNPVPPTYKFKYFTKDYLNQKMIKLNIDQWPKTYLMSSLQQSLKKSTHPNSAVYPEEKGGLGKEAWQQFSAEKSALAL